MGTNHSDWLLLTHRCGSLFSQYSISHTRFRFRPGQNNLFRSCGLVRHKKKISRHLQFLKILVGTSFKGAFSCFDKNGTVITVGNGVSVVEFIFLITGFGRITITDKGELVRHTFFREQSYL